MGTDDSRAGLERLVEDLVVVPKKILGAGAEQFVTYIIGYVGMF